MYESGYGVLKNEITAKSWYLLAEYNGYEKAIKHPVNVDENQAQLLAQGGVPLCLKSDRWMGLDYLCL